MDSKYKGMYRTRQKRNNRESNVETKPSNTCHVDSTASSGKKPTCCSSFTLLVFSALFTLLDGLLLAVGHYSLQRITTSLKHVEYHIPNYLTATMMVLTGLLGIIASKRRVKYLVVCVVFLSIICTMFCFVSFVYLLADVNSNLSRLQDCTFSAPEKVCKCFLPDDAGRRLLKFSAVQSCMAVKEGLRNLVYGVSVLFGVGFIISIITAIASSWLLYAEQRKSLQRSLIANIEEPIHMNSITTQTQESCLQARPRLTTTVDQESQGACARNLSVGTQTPIYMMPVAQLVYDVEADPQREYRMLNVTSTDRDEPPPPYYDAIVAP